MRQAVQLVPTPDDDRLKLLKIGLTSDGMSAVGLYMLEASAAPSPLGAKTASGFYRYDGGLTALGQQFLTGWHRVMKGGVELLLRNDHRVAVQMLSVKPGRAKGRDTVVAKFPRGSATQASVFTNGQQLGLFNLEQIVVPRPEAKTTTWFLAHFVSNGQLTVELLLPSQLDDDNKTIHLLDRIFVGVFGFRDEGIDITGGGDAPGLPPAPTITIVPR
jgi:hypothetical protein